MNVLQKAIDYSGVGQIGFSTGHNAHTGHVARDGDTDEAILWVPTTTLSDVEQDLPPGNYALICDIEGAELDLIEHEDFTRVDILILETHPDSYYERGSSTDILISQLAHKGLALVEQQGDVACFARNGAV